MDAWPEGPSGLSPDNGFGWVGTYSPLDIAHLQTLYGANTSTHAGDDIYTLPTQNQSGTFFTAIWDTGGSDTITAGSAANVDINLNAATLQYEIGGGGTVSYATGIVGGFTIANGVVIENALGGGGNDILTGNAVDNLLDGQDGNDRLFGGAGDDTLIGGKGDDALSGEAGADHFVFEGAHGNDRILDFETGSDTIRLDSAAYSFASLKIYQDGNDVIIISDGGTVTLVGIDMATLNDQDFVFRLVPETAPGYTSNEEANVSETNVVIVEKPIISDEDSFTFVDKAMVSDGDMDLPGDFTFDQDMLAAFLGAAQDINNDFISQESGLEIGHDTDNALFYFADFYSFV